MCFHKILKSTCMQDDHMTLNWGHWIFSERSATGDLQSGSSPVYEGSIDSLNFDNFLNVSHFTRTSLYQDSHQCSVPQKEVCMGMPDKPECSHPLSSLSYADKRESEQKDSHMLSKCTEDILAASVELMLQVIFSGSVWLVIRMGSLNEVLGLLEMCFLFNLVNSFPEVACYIG